jgi:molybdopterin-guanine dinucleotide biosynthesis protein A
LYDRWYHFPVSSRAGYVLVGGKSSRMGRDKALLPFRGTTLAQNIAEAVRAAAGSVSLVGSPFRRENLGYEVTPDLYPGEGPMGGILTALQNSTADWNLIVACDMPALSADFLRQLLDAADRYDADALLPQGPSGRPEPLCAVYHRRSRRSLDAAFARGVRKVTAALGEVRSVIWPVAEVLYFQNVNTPEDWASYDQ